MVRPCDAYYKKRFISIGNALRAHAKQLKISGVAIAGSRAKQRQNSESDEDIIICAAHDPIKRDFYPKLMNVLKGNFSRWKVYPGREYHVVHLDDPFNGGKFDLILLTEAQFTKEHKKNVLYRKENL